MSNSSVLVLGKAESHISCHTRSYVNYYHRGPRSASHYYDILGLTPKATQKQIKSAYYAMSKKYHPDVATGKENHNMFTDISEAYQVLGNIQKRRLYDRGLLNSRDPRYRIVCCDSFFSSYIVVIVLVVFFPIAYHIE